MLDPPPPVVASETQGASAGAAAVSGALASEAGEDEAAFVPVAARINDPLDDWEPDPVSSRLGRDGFGRWIVAGLAIVVAAAIGWSLYFLPRAAQQDADELAVSYGTSLNDLRDELAETQGALQTLTELASSSEAVAVAIPAIGGLNMRAAVVTGIAAGPLPSTPPFAKRTPFVDLEPIRATMLVLGAEAEGVASRLATAFAYRSAVPALFETSNLPVEADSGIVDSLSVDLAESLALTARLIADLPLDPTFTVTRDLASTASDRYAPWQLEYLDALREGETNRTTALVAELEDARRRIRVALETALATVRDEVGPRIAALDSETESAIDSIP